MASTRYNEIKDQLWEATQRLRIENDVNETYNNLEAGFWDYYQVLIERIHEEIEILKQTINNLESIDLKGLKNAEKKDLNIDISTACYNINQKISSYYKDIEKAFDNVLNEFYVHPSDSYDDCKYYIKRLKGLESQVKYLEDAKVHENILKEIKLKIGSCERRLEDFQIGDEIVKDEDGNVITVQAEAEKLRQEIASFWTTVDSKNTKSIKAGLKRLDELEVEVEKYKGIDIYYRHEISEKAVTYYDGMKEQIQSWRGTYQPALTQSKEKDNYRKVEKYREEMDALEAFGDIESCETTIKKLEELEEKVKRTLKNSEHLEDFLKEIKYEKDKANDYIKEHKKSAKMERKDELKGELQDFGDYTPMNTYQDCLDAEARLEKLIEEAQEFKGYSESFFYMESGYEYASNLLKQRKKETLAQDVKENKNKLMQIDDLKKLKTQIKKLMKRYNHLSFQYMPKGIKEVVKLKCSMSVQTKDSAVNPLSGNLDYKTFVMEIDQYMLEQQAKELKEAKRLLEANKKGELELSDLKREKLESVLNDNSKEFDY